MSEELSLPQFMMLVDFNKKEAEKQYEIAESLRAQVAKLTEELDKAGSYGMNRESVIRNLRLQVEWKQEEVAKLTEERDAYKDHALETSNQLILERMKADSESKSADHMASKLTAAESRIAELESALGIASTKLSGLFGYMDGTVIDALSRKSNLDALDAYRDSVIEECSRCFDDDSTDAREVLALKKGKV